MSFDFNDEKVYPMYAIEPVTGGGVEGASEREPEAEEEEPEAEEKSE